MTISRRENNGGIELNWAAAAVPANTHHVTPPLAERLVRLQPMWPNGAFARAFEIAGP
jgi:hypothetical protein